MSDKPSFFAELQRRNVYKVAVAYAIVGWLFDPDRYSSLSIFRNSELGRPTGRPLNNSRFPHCARHRLGL